MPTMLFISTAEAAFISDLSERHIHRVVDERLLPEGLFKQRGKSRLFTRLGAAFAKFYFETEDILVANARRQVLNELAARVAKLPAKSRGLNWTTIEAVCWTVERTPVTVDAAAYIREALSRAEKVDQANILITTDSEVMGGIPVFAGTRVSPSVVLSSLDQGVPPERLKDSYPFLTTEYIQAARVHAKVHPRRGRPRRLFDVNPDLPRRLVRTVKRMSEE